MANPFLVLGGVAASVVLAGVGILSVPGWVNAANDFAVIHDLSQVSDVQAASASKTGNYAKTVAELEDGVVDGEAIGANIQRSSAVPLAMSVNEEMTEWCAIGLSKSGLFWARSDSAPDSYSDLSVTEAMTDAGCDLSWSFVDGSSPEIVAAASTGDPGFAPGVINPAAAITPGPDTIVTALNWTMSPALGDGAKMCAAVTVTGENDYEAPWSLQIARHQAPVYNETHFYYENTPHQSIFSVGADQVTVTGPWSGTWNANWSNGRLTSERSLSLNLCTNVHTPPAVEVGTAWYSLEQHPSGTWTPTKACVTLEAHGNVDANYYPFAYGWEGTFDLRAAKQHIIDAGRTVNYVGFGPSPSQNYQFTTSSQTQPVLDEYKIQTGFMLALIGENTQSVEACVNGY